MNTNNQNEQVVLVNNQYPHILVPKDEHDKLIKENKELNNTLLILKRNERILQKTIDNHEKTIEEDKKLKKTLSTLKTNEKNLQKTIDNHENTIEKLKQEKHKLVMDQYDIVVEQHKKDIELLMMQINNKNKWFWQK